MAGFFFFFRLKRADNPLLAPYPAAPETAPAATAFPPAISAGIRAANGSIPPFWRLLVRLGAVRRLALFGMMLGMKGHTGGVSHLCSCRVMGHW